MGRNNYDDTHEKILECGKKHFIEYGFEKSSLRDICKDACVTTGAFYRHFNDDVLFGENWNNEDINLKTRSIITIVP